MKNNKKDQAVIISGDLADELANNTQIILTDAGGDTTIAKTILAITVDQEDMMQVTIQGGMTQRDMMDSFVYLTAQVWKILMMQGKGDATEIPELMAEVMALASMIASDEMGEDARKEAN